MNKIIFVLLPVFYISLTKPVFAGGCCFKSFFATEGIAGQKEAIVDVSFVDPENPFLDEGATTFRPLLDKKIEIFIDKPRTGQSCRMVNEVTDSNGYVKAVCWSDTPGTINVFFHAADYPKWDDWIGQGTRPVNFLIPTEREATKAGGRGLTPADISAQIVSRSAVHRTTSAGLVTDNQTTIPTQDLEQKVNQLEATINRQQNQVNTLSGVVQKITSFLSKIFSFN